MVLAAESRKKKIKFGKRKKKKSVRGGIRTHAHIRGPEDSNSHCEQDLNLESGALDRSATLTDAQGEQQNSIILSPD